MLYRTKPLIVEVFKWTNETGQFDDAEWVLEKFVSGEIEIINNKDLQPSYMQIKTNKGTKIAKIGDYIVKSEDGSISEVNGILFEKTYEKVE